MNAAREIGRLRGVLILVVEALEVGDTDGAHGLAIAGLDEGIFPESQRSGVPVPLMSVCRECGARFEWPGLLDHHERFAHRELAA